LVCDIENFAVGVDKDKRRDKQDRPHCSSSDFIAKETWMSSTSLTLFD
jgi:hypothetical protein